MLTRGKLEPGLWLTHVAHASSKLNSFPKGWWYRGLFASIYSFWLSFFLLDLDPVYVSEKRNHVAIFSFFRGGRYLWYSSTFMALFYFFNQLIFSLLFFFSVKNIFFICFFLWIFLRASMIQLFSFPFFFSGTHPSSNSTKSNI